MLRWITLLVLSTVASAAPAADDVPSVARVDLHFIKATDRVGAIVCYGDDPDDCHPWAHFYVYEVRLRKTIHGAAPPKKFRAIYSRHALRKKDFRGVVALVRKLDEAGVDGETHQIADWAERVDVWCFRRLDLDGKADVKVEDGERKLNCYKQDAE
jgi:hypothetical protein